MSLTISRITSLGAMLGAILASGGLSAQTTILVPAQQPTIQAGIDAAQDGDTVLVAAGIYVETIEFLGKAITVESRDGASFTTIDAAGAGSVVHMVAGEGPGSVLAGFTLTGGTGSPMAFPAGAVGGGGLYVEGSGLDGPVIRSCHFTGNHVPDDGGGVVSFAAITRFEGCTFTGNSAARGGAYFGLNLGPDGTLVGCELRGNVATTDGGAVYGQATTLTDCLVAENTAGGDGGGVHNDFADFSDCSFEDNVAGGDGGGAYVGGSMQVDGPLLVRRNHADGSGGGIYFRDHIPSIGVGGTLVSTGLRVLDNTADGDGGGLAILFTNNSGGIFGGPADVVLRLEQLVLAGNAAGGLGGALWADMSGNGANSLELVHATVADNLAANGPAFELSVNGGTLFSSSVVWSNDTPLFGLAAASGVWSIVQGGLSGIDNLDADPLFVDADADDYGLKGGSPAIDSANPASPPDADGSPADRGAMAFEPWVLDGPGLSGAAGEPVLVVKGLNSPGAVTDLKLSNAAPGVAGFLVMGASKLGLPFKGGVMVPAVDELAGPVPTDALGGIELQGHWHPSLPSDHKSWLQMWFLDPTGPFGWTASNGLKGTTR